MFRDHVPPSGQGPAVCRLEPEDKVIRAGHLPLNKPGQSLAVVAQCYAELWPVAVTNQNYGYFSGSIRLHLVEVNAFRYTLFRRFNVIPCVLTACCGKSVAGSTACDGA